MLVAFAKYLIVKTAKLNIVYIRTDRLSEFTENSDRNVYVIVKYIIPWDFLFEVISVTS